jgi:hypothetical protein
VNPKEPQAQAPIGLDEARQRLRELGYLSGAVERFVFRRALEGRGGLLLPAVLLGALAAAVAALAAVDAGEPGFGSSVASVCALLLHLFLADLLPASLAALAVALWADRSRAPAEAATAVGLLSFAAIFTLWIGGVWGLARAIPPRSLLWGAPVSVVALLLARSARSGFLARAYAHSRVLPARPRSRVFFAAAVAGVLVAVGIFASRGQAPAVAAPHPSPRSGTVVVAAIDGLGLDGQPGPALAGMQELFGRGRTAWWPAPAGVSPPEIWTDLATGQPASRHGVRALERVRPRGSPLSLRPPFGTGWYLRRLGPRLSLVSAAPVSGRDRQSLAFWEVTASAGLPSLAVGWWASGPWPGAEVVGNEEILARAADGIVADRDALVEFGRRRQDGEPVQTVYLPGLDILRNDPGKRSVELAQVRRFLEDEISRALAGPGALIVIAADSHPRSGALGRMTVFDGAGEWKMIRARPSDVTPSILARAGVPPAQDLAGQPLALLFRGGSLETTTVATYGPRIAPAAPRSRQSDREYLEKLKSLGYLN